MIALVLSIVLIPLTAHASATYETPTNSDFKSYMSYTAITNTSSAQFKLQQVSDTDSSGLRTYNNRYMVAVGTFFQAQVGTYIDVELSSGAVLPCVVGDIKKNSDTDEHNLQASNGNIIEFIVDGNVLDTAVKKAGSISTLPGFDGYVYKVTVLDSVDIIVEIFESALPSLNVFTTHTEAEEILN